MDEYIQAVINFANENVDIAPYAIFGLLLLAGFNLPISEDLMNFTSGFLASQNPDHVIPLYIGILFGCYFSDMQNLLSSYENESPFAQGQRCHNRH